MAYQPTEEQWKLLAEQYRKAAEKLPEGPEREELLEKARQIEGSLRAPAK